MGEKILMDKCLVHSLPSSEISNLQWCLNGRSRCLEREMLGWVALGHGSLLVHRFNETVLHIFPANLLLG